MIKHIKADDIVVRAVASDDAADRRAKLFDISQRIAAVLMPQGRDCDIFITLLTADPEPEAPVAQVGGL